VNDSTSLISPAWPTRWPKDSFTGVWTWLLAGFIALIFVATFFAALKMSAFPIQPVSPIVFDASLLLQFVLEGLLVALVLAAIPPLAKFSLRELGFRMPSGKTIGTALLGAVAMAIVANGGASLIDYLAHSQHQQDIVEIFKGLHDPKTIALFAGFAVVFAPFAEETFFRLLFFNLGLRYGGFWSGAVLSGVLFGVAHGDLYAALPLALGGIVLCAVYYRTGNIFAPMLSHALFNALSIAALLVAPQITR
jgi:membrane protease YdiL (CAAX protease family)